MPISLEKVDLFLCAKELPSMQLFSQTDAFAVVSMRDGKHDVLKRVGTTAVIKDSANPSWAMPITCDYMFEVDQEVVVTVYQWDGNHHVGLDDDLKHHTVIGQTFFRMSELMRSPDSHLVRSRFCGTCGTLEVNGEVQVHTRDQLCVTFQGEKLANKDGFFGKSDPFIVASRINEDGTYTVVWKSNKIDNNLNPHWSRAKIPMTQLCNGDIYRPLRLEIFDWDSDGGHDIMGTVDCSVNDLLEGGGGRKFPVIEEAKKKKKGSSYKNSGHLVALDVKIEYRPTFADFISNGMEMNMIVAIDFTGSNGDPAMPDSLHDIDPTGERLNPYQHCITAVGTVLEAYDTDKSYPVYGFGARRRKEDGSIGAANHCFSVRQIAYGQGAGKDDASIAVEATSVEGILQAYKDSLDNVVLAGPTLFEPFVEAAERIATASPCSQDKQRYTVALIITDGVINDMEGTKEALCRASVLPLSFVIVGVGNADFSAMRELDGDRAKLFSGRATAARDIVQFVPYTDQELPVLAAQVLAEIPNQVLQFMGSKNIHPNKPQQPLKEGQQQD